MSKKPEVSINSQQPVGGGHVVLTGTIAHPLGSTQPTGSGGSSSSGGGKK